MLEPTIRPSTEADLPSIQAIYAEQVLHGTATFELVAPNVAEMGRRRETVLARGWPWLVLEVGGEVVGYAYADEHNARAGYRFTVEDSIYLAVGARGQGLGRRLLAALIEDCERRGARQMLARIGDSANLGSIRLHSSLGFEQVGLFHSLGWKFGEWRDVVCMQRELGLGGRRNPE